MGSVLSGAAGIAVGLAVCLFAAYVVYRTERFVWYFIILGAALLASIALAVIANIDHWS